MDLEDGPEARRIERLLGRYLEQKIVHGVEIEPETLCREDPELLEPLRDCIRDYEQLDQALSCRDGLAPGRTLLHYRIVRKLGAGGMGEVYLAQDLKLGRQVALKVLPPEMAGDPERLERFEREARAVAALNHPNIVTLHSIEETEGVHFLTMELVEGTTLSERIPPHGMDLSELFGLAIPLAGALAAAHERNITHRDLKPDNVMVDAGGRVKILDFGLAKHRCGPASDDSTTLTATLTGEGHILGTVPYMSPEQILGKPADARSDIFSLGVMLYQMATGQRPFEGRVSAELISAILRDTPVSIEELRGQLPHHLGRIVRHCLEKEPERRYQSALDVRNELADLEREVITGDTGASTAAGVARRRLGAWGRWLAAGGAAVILAIGAAYLQLRPGTAGVEAPVPSISAVHAQPSLAVFFFDNMTRDPDLEWLGYGLAEMLTTDLSQVPDLEVLSIARLRQVLADHDALEHRLPTFKLLQGLAESTGVEAVVRGSYVRSGDDLRIDVSLEQTSDGAILDSMHVRGRLEESLFAMVGELSATVRRHFDVERPADSPTAIQDVTTWSFDAWRLYTEAIDLSYQSKQPEAIERLEEAVEIDPSFALALVNLGIFHENLGHTEQARGYKRRAFERAERLPLDLRYRIEGEYYSTWATYDRGIESYLKGLRLYPDRRESWQWRGALAWRYAYLEMYEEAEKELSKLIAGGATYPGYYTLAADVLAAQGRFESGRGILEAFSSRHQDNWKAQLKLGWLMVEWGKLEAAERYLDRAAELRPGDYGASYCRWRLHIRRGDLKRAAAEAAEMKASDNALGRWRGTLSQARNLTYRGQSEEAIGRFDEAIAAWPSGDAFRALVRCWKAELLLQRGEAARALSEARLAQEEGREEFPELKGLFLAALAEQRLGRPAAAEAIERTLWRRRASHPNRIEERQLHHLAGLLALERGDARAAIKALVLAESLLPPEGIEIHWHVYPEHVPIWYALGRAELAAGRSQEALRWFEQVASSSEHVEQPVPYVRSFYHLGRIHQDAGEADEARQSFERFLRHWRESDIDGEWVAAALAYTQS